MKRRIKNTKVRDLKVFLILWSTQSLSQLGSSMTAFALTLWLDEETGSALKTATLTIMSGINLVASAFDAALPGYVIPNPRGGTVMLGGGGNPALSDFREKTEAISVSGRVILRSDEMSRKSKGLPLWRKPFLFVLLWAVPAAAT